ncbi:MAG: flagellar biosynthetic protein FliR [Pseudomonadota bacterium]
MIELLNAEMQNVLLIFCRIGAMFMVLPGFSSARVPTNVRLLLALTVTLAMVPLIPRAAPGDLDGTAALLPAIVSEILFGAMIGLLVRFYFLALEFIMTGVAMSIGLSGIMGMAIEGQEAQPALTNFISFAALTLLFLMDFQHMVLRAVADSYSVVPMGLFPDVRVMMMTLLDSLVQSFRVALQLGSPFLVYAIVVNVALGFINKLALQVPVYFVALPFILFGFLFILFFSAQHILLLFSSGLEAVFNGPV